MASQSVLQWASHTHTGKDSPSLGNISKQAPVVCLICHNACRCLELTDNDPSYHLYAFGTGYLNVLGQAANLACSAYLTADCIDFMVQEINGHQFTPLETLLTYASESQQGPLHGQSYKTLIPCIPHVRAWLLSIDCEHTFV